jgi:hypothetical protein
MSYIDYTKLTQDNVKVYAMNNYLCGTIQGEEGEDIMVKDDENHFYKVSKSKVMDFDGSQLNLNISHSDFKNLEDKQDPLESIDDSIKHVKESL